MPAELAGMTYRHWCIDCAQLVTVHEGNYPLTAFVTMAQHYATTKHYPMRVEKRGPHWVVLRGERVFARAGSQRHAFFIAFENHPWTEHKRAEHRLTSSWR